MATNKQQFALTERFHHNRL